MIQRLAVAIAFIVSLFGTGSGGTQDRPRDLENVCHAATIGVAEVGEIYESREQPPVFILEEYHNSRLGQLQLAVILLRLHRDCGVDDIALEGAVRSQPKLDCAWFHDLGGPGARHHREDTAVRLLACGDISAAEFMALLFTDVTVHCIEEPGEYSVTASTEVNPIAAYLVFIAAQLLSEEDLKEYEELSKNGEDLGPAVEFLLSRDPWVRVQAGLDESPMPDLSIEGMLDRSRAIERKAKEVGVEIPEEYRSQMREHTKFLEMGIKRTKTLARRSADIALQTGTSGVALQTGAGHTAGLMRVLREAGVPFARITPLALNVEPGRLSSTQLDRKLRGMLVAEERGTLGFLLNRYRKPPPVVGSCALQSYASMNLACLVLAEAAKTGEWLSTSIRSELSALPSARVDMNSIQRDGYDVVFRAWLIDTNGDEVEVWARTGMLASEPEATTLEDRLLQAIRDLGDDETGIRTPAPPGCESADDTHGPGDGVRRGVVVSRVSLKAVAVFASSRDEVWALGRLSG